MRNNNDLPILTLSYEGKQSNDTRNMKNINFVPEDIQSNSIICEKHNEREVFYIKRCT